MNDQKRLAELGIESTFRGIKYISNPNFRPIITHHEHSAILTSTSSSATTAGSAEPKTAKESICEFGAESSVHGVKYVTDHKIGIFRR